MIVLDTHVWVWWVSDPKQLSQAAGELIDMSVGGGDLYVSSISAWEVALLVQKGRLELIMPVTDWIAKSESLPFMHFVPVDNQIALRSTALVDPITHDPADRMIVATAISLGAKLVTKDRDLRSYPHVETVW